MEAETNHMEGETMSRVSNDEFNEKGELANGFDYDLQVWVEDGLVQDCGHPRSAAFNKGKWCCNAHRFASMDLDELKAAIAEGDIAA